MDCSPPGSSVHGNSPSKNTGSPIIYSFTSCIPYRPSAPQEQKPCLSTVVSAAFRTPLNVVWTQQLNIGWISEWADEWMNEKMNKWRHGPNKSLSRMSACTGGRWHELREAGIQPGVLRSIPCPLPGVGEGAPDTQQTWAQPWLICLGTHLTQPRCCQEDMCTWFFFLIPQIKLAHIVHLNPYCLALP